LLESHRCQNHHQPQQAWQPISSFRYYKGVKVIDKITIYEAHTVQVLGFEELESCALCLLQAALE
jgi:hypothetical protein